MAAGATLSPGENIGWDDDSDSESQPASPNRTSTPKASKNPIVPSTSSSTTIQPKAGSSEDSSLKPTEAASRRSQDQHSQPDSDASYDLVSGATSRAPGSPKDEKKKPEGEASDEEPDWE